MSKTFRVLSTIYGVRLLMAYSIDSYKHCLIVNTILHINLDTTFFTHTFFSSAMKADSTCKPFYLTLFDKILSFALSLIEQLPTEYDKSTFELPEDIIQLHSEVAEALKEVLMLSMYCCDDIVIKLLKQIQLPATLKTLYQCTESLILECKF